MIFFLVNLQDSIIGWKNLRKKICETDHFVGKFAVKQCGVRSTIIVKRAFVRFAMKREDDDGYGVPYGLAYQRGRGTRTSRVPLISRQHAPLIISLITATWTRRGL